MSDSKINDYFTDHVLGSSRKTGSNVISFRCNRHYTVELLVLREFFASQFGLDDPDELPVSAVIKAAIEWTYADVRACPEPVGGRRPEDSGGA